MLARDFAGNCALEVACRAGRILPVLQSHLDIEDLPRLTELQQVALGSVLLIVFDGLSETLGRMAEVKAALEGLGIGDEAEAWLSNRDTEPLL